MKLSLISILLFVCVNAFAAPHSIVDRYVDDFMVHMRTETILTNEQTQAMANVLYDSINEREDIVESYSGETSLSSTLAMKKELEAVNDLMNTEVKQILDEKQYEAFQKVQKEHAEKLKKRLKERKQNVS